MIRLAGSLLLFVGCIAIWISTRDGNGNVVFVGLMGGIDVSAGLLILVAMWPRRRQETSNPVAIHIFRK